MGRHIMQRLSSWPAKHGIVGDVRGRGLMIGVEIIKDKESKAPAGEARDRIVELAFERGLLFLGAGDSAIRIAPPLIVTKEQADIAVDVLEECITAVAKQPESKKAGPGRPVGT
jgi:4-aminobutyrate aminotransferase